VTDVRNQRLVAWTSAADEWKTLFYIPNDWVCILKHLSIYNGAAGSAVVELVLHGETSNLYMFSKTMTTLEVWHWEGAICMNPSDYLQIHAGAALVVAWASGAMLSGGPPWPTMPSREVEPLPAAAPTSPAPPAPAPARARKR
jgi:hypothetical protein